MAEKTVELPADLAAARTRINKWRSSGRARKPIPEDLWEMAAALVPAHGVYRVSRTLRLRYDKVKAAAKAHHRKRKSQNKSTFIEVAAPTLAMPSLTGELMVEVKDTRGNHMCISSLTTVDAARLVNAFCGGST